MKELLAFIEKRDLSLTERALAHYQAQRLLYDIEHTFDSWYPPYEHFSSSSLLPVGSPATYDHSLFQGQGTLMSISPPHLKVAVEGESVLGIVIASWEHEYQAPAGQMHFGGLFLYSSKTEKVGISTDS